MHESGFGRFNPETLNLSPNAIPTLQVVDDTFTKHRDVMAAIIAKARERAGIQIVAGNGKRETGHGTRETGSGKRETGARRPSPGQSAVASHRSPK